GGPPRQNSPALPPDAGGRARVLGAGPPPPPPAPAPPPPAGPPPRGRPPPFRPPPRLESAVAAPSAQLQSATSLALCHIPSTASHDDRKFPTVRHGAMHRPRGTRSKLRAHADRRRTMIAPHGRRGATSATTTPLTIPEYHGRDRRGRPMCR